MDVKGKLGGKTGSPAAHKLDRPQVGFIGCRPEAALPRGGVRCFAPYVRWPFGLPVAEGDVPDMPPTIYPLPSSLFFLPVAQIGRQGIDITPALIATIEQG